MKSIISGARPQIRIRAANPWLAGHGVEPDHIPLSPADQSELARLADVITFETKGSYILTQGEPARFLYLLSDGVLMASRVLNHGDRQVVAFYWPGDLFGLAEAGSYVNSIEAITACTVLRFPVSALEAFFLKNPAIQHRFLIKAIHDLRTTQRQLIVMGRFDIARRLAVFLLDCSGHESYFDSATKIITLPMSRYDIADYLGTSAESITRAIAALEQRGLVRRVTPRAIELRPADIKSFADLA